MRSFYRKTSFPGVLERRAASGSKSKLLIIQCPMLTTSLGILIYFYLKGCQPVRYEPPNRVDVLTVASAYRRRPVLELTKRKCSEVSCSA